MGELANTLEGRNGGERANRMEARLSARPLGGRGARGTSGGVAREPEGRRRAAPRGERGPAVSSAAPYKPPCQCPLRFSPLWWIRVWRGDQERGVSNGGKTEGGTGIPGPPAALFCEDGAPFCGWRASGRQRSGRNFEPGPMAGAGVPVRGAPFPIPRSGTSRAATADRVLSWRLKGTDETTLLLKLNHGGGFRPSGRYETGPRARNRLHDVTACHGGRLWGEVEA